MNAKARKPTPKKPVPAPKAGKTGAKPPAATKHVVKKTAPAKPTAKPSKPVAKKPAAKPVPAKKAVSTKAVVKKASPAKAAVKKPVAKKAAVAKPMAKKPSAKPVLQKVVKAAAKPVPAKKVAAKTAAKTPVSAKKPVAKQTVPAKKSVVQKPLASKKVTAKAVPAKAPVKASPKGAPKPAPKTTPKTTTPKTAKPVAKAAAKPAKTAKPEVVAPVVHVVPIIPGYTPVVHKKNSRAAKMAALVPPPPAAVVVTNAAKSSFMPMTVPTAPSIVPVIPKKDPKLANNWKNKTADKLSDAEVIAMPDSEYMNDTQMAFFRLKLSKLKDEVLSNASETTEHLREDTVVTPDPADRATIEEEHALELRTRDRERKLLKKIEQSINRIDAGDYGYCDETGEAIGVGRLLARPTATLSLEAQERRELKQKMFGD